MANEIAEAKNTAVGGLGGLVAGLKRHKTTRPAMGGKAYLKMAKDGEWTVGRGSDAMNGEKVVFNPNTIKTGYAAVESGEKKFKVHAEVMKLITEGAVDVTELDDMGSHIEWKFNQSIEGRFLTGDRQEFQYGTTSYGGQKALEAVTDAILERVASGEEVYLFPVVQIDSDWYDHPTWKKTYEPILEIVGWADVEGVLEGATKKAVEKQPEEAEEEAPELGEEEAPDTDNDAGEADEPPVRRRRRR